MKKHIFLIDDDREDLLIFMDAFNTLPVPCKCTLAKAYDHAMKMLKYLVPDCIFIRMGVDGQNGLEMINRIRNEKVLRNVHLVIYADQLNSSVIKEAIRHGADFCIEKPRGSLDLQRLLMEIFGQYNPVYALHA